MCKQSFLILWLLSIIVGYGQAQPKNLRITVRDQQNEILPGAHVLLKNLSDNSEWNAVTDANGKATFQQITDGLYQCKISFIGYETFQTTLKITPFARNFEFKLKSETISLNEVTVSAPKPIIRQEEDKTIIDPEPVANASTNTMEVLETTPGLYVDQDGGVYIAGTTPAKIYINGREQKLSNQDIATILRSLPPNSVEKIEIIRSPSTKYDAATTGGIINIVLKKGVKLGQFGSINLGANQGFLGNRFINLSYNNSAEKWTYYANINANIDGRLEELNSTRNINSDTILLQESDSRIKAHQYYTGYGATYEANDKWSFSYDGRINYSNRNTVAENTNNLKNTSESIILNSVNENLTTAKLFNVQQDFSSVLKIDTADSKWENKLSFNFQHSSSEQDYTTKYMFPSFPEINGLGNNRQQRYFVVLQSDLVYPLPYKIKLETGLKASMQNLHSNTKYSYIINWQETLDNKKTNQYVFDENIFAAYAQFSKMLIAEITLKTGVRLEHTSMIGHQTIPYDTSFSVNRSDYFPYVYLSRKIFDRWGVELFAFAIYRRTINRPGYQELNPYIRYIDEFMYETGNPALKPQFTDNYELNISYNDMPVFAIGKNYTTDIFSNVMYEDTTLPGAFIRTFDNLGKSSETYFRGIAGIPPGGKYFFGIGGQYSLLEYDGFYQNKPLYFKRGSWRFFTFHQLKISKTTKLNVSGFLMTKGIWSFLELKNFGQLNIGLNQTFFDQKLQITINVRDVLRTMETRFSYNLSSMPTYGSRYADNQRIGINIRYNFGIKNKEDKKQLFKHEEEM
ncbi:MAG: TonB-dependent receptor [Bacteroidales bacterium]|nr:TonB-dependent receptor [Bacteroidales bacterium]